MSDPLAKDLMLAVARVSAQMLVHGELARQAFEITSRSPALIAKLDAEGATLDIELNRLADLAEDAGQIEIAAGIRRTIERRPRLGVTQ
jgi:hypothetical protein